ncbi:50S ribosome-binding GTPase [Cryptosporangium arvum]|uniref:50S ribosome-binding GTPase n=1 Tax=Cryptosporangium arvum TaxID=80871 RepID=UPI0004B54F16|nr:50S ribosome-binding GTPase [Cryptosporangium arvum]
MSRPSAADELPSIAARLTSLERVMGVVDSRVDDNALRSARDVTRQITERMSLSPAHTVVALAGATGSGKSSIYNALAGLDLSEVGVRRPVTNAPHACVWGPDGAGPLLDWLSIPYDNRTGRESALDADSQAELRGLVLLDLPDHDSTQLAHRLEVDRLVELVDLLVWVLDPQKYADEAVHSRYLRRLSRHAGVTLVVLNQVDMLSSAETEACLADVRRLLDADGLRGVPLVPLSALRGDGMPELKDRITATVSSRQAAVRRLAADLDTVADELAPLAGPEVREGVDRAAAKRLYTTLAEAAGVGAVGEAVERGFKFTASRSFGWPLIHWFGRTKSDPLAPLRENATKTRRRTTARPAVLHPVQLPAVEESLRLLADETAEALPDPWPRLVHRAARSEIDQLPDALDRAVATADLGLARRPLWWWGYRAVQYLMVLALLGGLAWTLGLAIAAAVGDALEVGDLVVPLTLLFGGLVLGPVLHVVGMIVARRGARQARLRAEQAVLDAVTTVARDRVLGPVRAELSAYAQVRDALLEFGISTGLDTAPAAESGPDVEAEAPSGLGPLPPASNYPDPFERPAAHPAPDTTTERPGLVGPRPVRPSTMFSEAASTSAPTPSGAVEPETGQAMTHSTPPGNPDRPASPPPPEPDRPLSEPDRPLSGAGRSETSRPAAPGWAGSVPPPPRPDAVRRGAIPPAPATPPVAPGLRPFPGANTPPPPVGSPPIPGLPRPGTPISSPSRSGQPNAGFPTQRPGGSSPERSGSDSLTARPTSPGRPGGDPSALRPGDPSALRPGVDPSAVRPGADSAAARPGDGAASGRLGADSAAARLGARAARAGAELDTARSGAAEDGGPSRSPHLRRSGPKLPPAPPPRPEVEADPEVVWARTRPNAPADGYAPGGPSTREPADRPSRRSDPSRPDPDTAPSSGSEALREDQAEQSGRKGLRGFFNRRKESADVVDRWWATADDGDDPFGRPSSGPSDDDSRVPGQR